MALGAINVNEELTQILEGDPTVRARDRNKILQNAWLSELIRIRRLDDENKLQKGCEWRISRRRLTRAYIQNLVDKCPLPCSVDYFYDNNNISISMEEFQLKALTDPTFYVIVPRILKKPDDALSETTYSGQTQFIVEHVPLTAYNGTVVDNATMREWLLAAIAEIDPISGRIYNEMEIIKDKIKEIENKIRLVPNLDLRDPSGKPLPDEKADEERQILYIFYGEEKMRIQEDLRDKEMDLEEHILWRREMGIELFKADVDEIAGTAVWFVKIFGTSDADVIEDLLIEKDDWRDIRLAVGDKQLNLPPWAGRDPVPDGTKIQQPDYTPLLVQIAEASVSRIKHGTGTYKSVDNKKRKKEDNNKFGIYYGDWDMGKMSGHGISITDTGVYSGRHVNGRRRGHASVDLANGTTFTGQFGVQLQRNTHDHGDFENPYLEGEPQGEVEILFSDGAKYKGGMIDGKINGYGEYESAFGEIYRGTFINGVLDGNNCYLKNYAGEVFEGRFVCGELDGFGKYSNPSGTCIYEGYWKHGMKHGRGVEKNLKKHIYQGYFTNGNRSGKAVVEYGGGKKKIKKKKNGQSHDANTHGDIPAAAAAATTTAGASGVGNISQKETKGSTSKQLIEETKSIENEDLRPLSQFKSIYEGFLIANHPSVRGVLTDTESHTIRQVAKSNPALSGIISLHSKDERARLRMRRKVEKFKDIELFIRSDIERKKSKIFRQQKHFTKKIMRTEKEMELDDRAIESQFEIRQDRLDKIQPDKLQSKRALVPRLAEPITQEPWLKLQQSFDRVNVEEDFGEVDTVLARLAISNFDESVERQRLIKYDKLWERAELAYAEKKKLIAQASSHI